MNTLAFKQPNLLFNLESEGENIEFKSASLGRLPQDLWEPITAFSNADGGVIYFGIDKDGIFVALTKEHLDKIQRDVVSQCQSMYSHKLYPEISVREGVVSVFIRPAPAVVRPIYLRRKGCPQGARVRIGSSNIQVDDEWIRKFAVAAEGGAEILEYKGDYTSVFDEIAISNYLTIIAKKRGPVYQNLSRIEILKKLRTISDTEFPTLFGLLAFGNERSPQEVLGPTFNIAVTQYLGTTKVDETNPEATSLDDQEFDGSAYQQFRGAFRFIISKLPVRGKIGSEGKRQDYLAIPEVAIREALANAVAHRDYSADTSRIQVDIYSDRIEFINPGTSLVPLQSIEDAPPQSRNPLLMNHLKDLGIVEQRGRGIKTIKTSLQKAGLKEPVFVHRDGSFVAVLYSSVFLSSEDQRWLSRFSKFKFNNRQLHVLVHLRHEQSGIANQDYRSLNHMTNVGDDIRAKKDLQRLVERGILEPVGERRYRQYKLHSDYQ